MEFTQISLHAISSDTAHFPRACIYMQLDAPERDGGAGEGDGDEDAAPEVRLAPSDAGSREFSLCWLWHTLHVDFHLLSSRGGGGAVEEIFKALCECATLNPDPGLDGAPPASCQRSGSRLTPACSRALSAGTQQRTARTATSSTTRTRWRPARAGPTAWRASTRWTR